MTEHLTASALSQHEEDEKSIEFGKTDTIMSTDSMIDPAQETSEEVGLFRDIIKTENDLAGFSIAWTAGFVIVIILRISDHEDVRDAYWWWIFLIPIAICCLTWIFSYIITKYRKDESIESMKIPAFILPFICKIGIAIFFFGRLFYSAGGITDRYQNVHGYNGWCDCNQFVIYLSLILSTLTTEIIITTVMINSSQNLRPKIPRKVDVFLFITRPTLWVYNRLIVMFLTFYCFYYVFGIGPLCTSQCKVDQVAHVSSIGVSIFTLPFHNILYLFKWESFDLRQHTNSKQVTFAVIQQVLIFTTILDFLMDIWSVAQICKRFEGGDLDKLTSQIRYSLKGYKLSPKGDTSKSMTTPITPSINEAIKEDDKNVVQTLESTKAGHIKTDTVDDILNNIPITTLPDSPDVDPDVDSNIDPKLVPNDTQKSFLD